MVAVGVTGHRKLKNIDKISTGVEEAIQKIKDVFPNEVMTIISPIAEGADRLVVWRAMERDKIDLVVPLPMDVSEYMRDFERISSQAEFVTLLEEAATIIELPTGESREACYLAAGEYVLDNSDVLIAIWDGQPARGLAGTGNIVAQARARKIPLAWIYAVNKEGSPGSGDEAEKVDGEVSYENFP